MSRIIVKNVPNFATNKIIEDHFKKKSGFDEHITDVVLKYNDEGKFRGFCFVGFASEGGADIAAAAFNKSFIGNRQISVEKCTNRGEATKAKKFEVKSTTEDMKGKGSAPSTGDPKKKSKKADKILEILGDRVNEPEFREYLEIRDKSRLVWANDALISEAQPEPVKKTDSASVDKSSAKLSQDNVAVVTEAVGEFDAKTENLADKPISDMEYMQSLMAPPKNEHKPGKTAKESEKTKPEGDQDFFTIKIRNLPYTTKREQIKKLFKDLNLKPASVRLPTKTHGFCYVGFKTEREMRKAMQKDKTFIKANQLMFSEFTEQNKASKNNRKVGGITNTETAPQKLGNAKWLQQEESMQNVEPISESGSLYFRNLSYSTTEDELQKLFEEYGQLTELKLPVDVNTRQIKGYGTVTYLMPEHAVVAYNKLDGCMFKGRLLHLMPCKDFSQVEDDQNTNDAALSFKERKQRKLKRTAGQSECWNTFFLGVNAVAEAIAKQLNVSKDKLLDINQGGSSAAVRLALGETQMVMELKTFLEEHGVRLGDDDRSEARRSKTRMLVKNLPAATTLEEFKSLTQFTKFSGLRSIVMPTSGVIALIEYETATEAKKAFSKHVFYNYKSLPLFLEWAPEQESKSSEEVKTGKKEDVKIEEQQPAPSKTTQKSKHGKSKEEIVVEQVDEKKVVEAPAGLTADDEELPEENTTLFLRNLNFKTVKETVYRHFQHLGKIHMVEIAQRRDADQVTSLGYGFIQFKQASVADRALKTMQFTTIDGKEVELKRSDRTLKDQHAKRRKPQVSAEEEAPGTKLQIRNVPFQMKQEELRDYFKTFGNLNFVRLPKKPGNSGEHRGFGFVDFVSKADAAKAFQAVKASVHFYNRRLVVEWANDEKSVEDIRKRTAEKFGESEAKRSRKAVFKLDESSGTHNDIDKRDNEED